MSTLVIVCGSVALGVAYMGLAVLVGKWLKRRGGE